MSKIKDFMEYETEKLNRKNSELVEDAYNLQNILFRYTNKEVAYEIYKINPEYALEIAEYIKQLDYNNYLENQGALWQS